MDYFGINTAEDLPKIKEVLADQLVEPTVIKDTIAESGEEETTTEAADDETALSSQEGKTEGTDDDVLLSVTEDGELVDKAHDEEE